MVDVDTKLLKVRKNLVSSRFAIVLTTVGGAHPPGLTLKNNTQDKTNHTVSVGHTICCIDNLT